MTPKLSERFVVSSSWVWGPSADAGLPPNGEKILLRRGFKPAKPVRFAGIITAAENAFVLYLNNEKVFSGSGWANLRGGSLATRLSDDANEILIVAENRGSKPNVAGVFCAIYLQYLDGTVETIVTDESWQVSETVPEETLPANWKLDEQTWHGARVLNDTEWKEKTDANTGIALAKTFVESDRMLRSSLLKSDSLMRSLGRPNRDQIVTSRPNELTALEAIDLSTSSILIENLRAGAESITRASESNAESIIEEVYYRLLSRPPNKKEKALLRKALGRYPDVEVVTDVLWAIVMTPEFFIIR